jgi:hypothetical protein
VVIFYIKVKYLVEIVDFIRRVNPRLLNLDQISSS